MRREELVRAGDQQVRAKVGDVDRQMGSRVDRVDVDDRADRMRSLDHAPDIGDRPQRIGGEPHRDDARPLRQDVGERIEVQRRPILAELDPANRGAPVRGHRQPGGDVRVVVEPGHHDLVTRGDLATESAADPERDRGHVRPERDLVGVVGAEEVGTGRMDLVQHASVSTPAGKAPPWFALLRPR